MEESLVCANNALADTGDRIRWDTPVGVEQGEVVCKGYIGASVSLDVRKEAKGRVSGNLVGKGLRVRPVDVVK